ncbi:uncharacterized protein LOC109003248 isoform X3 [Juglans regia]|uniref:Uncharacterized protein LOC109003248 isoform X3 n=2 Tax=Juglans regia TaxID=51240 RepID=A0A2I4FYY9_JUGRE|nr:uncharacterized protein LOC109003248 isoform X3 [Juglans regia]XP_035542622.1 uncharacterized protein LOC109003248 isoform X3 [Juglans regia]XP_035542623.1 uncharacterized protein LOC109003248 isoform X3 [Juglans regia]
MSRFGRTGPPDITDTYSLLVLNVTFRTTADDLFPYFDKYGKVVDIFIPRNRRTGDSRGFAFVRYKYADEAQKAVDRLDAKKGELLNRPQGQEVAVLAEGTEMTIEIRITEEGAVEVLIDMIVISMGGKGIIFTGVGVAVLVPTTIGLGEEAVIMMSIEAEAIQWIVRLPFGVVPVFTEVLHHKGLHLLGVKILIGSAVREGPQLLSVFHPGVGLPILEANPLES